MTDVPGLWPLQKTVMTLLAADAGVKALLGDPARIWDTPPGDATFPYLLIGAMTANEWGARDFDGADVLMTIEAVDNIDRGSGTVKQLSDIVRHVLDNQKPAMSAGTIILMKYDGRPDDQTESDGLTWRGPSRFRVLLQFN